MLRISIDHWKMGGYLSYFVEDPMIHLCHRYSVQLRGYDAWKKYIMTLIRFKEIYSAFHPEAGTSFCGEICHQMRYFIRMFNGKAKIIFVLGEHGVFGKVGIVMRIRYCPVHMYNKDKLDKLIVYFSSWPILNTISFTILMCTKVKIQQKLTSTHHYTT